MSNLSTHLMLHPSNNDIHANETGQMSPVQVADYVATKRWSGKVGTFLFGIIAIILLVIVIIIIRQARQLADVTWVIFILLFAIPFTIGTFTSLYSWLFRKHPILPIKKETGTARLSIDSTSSAGGGGMTRHFQLLINHTQFTLTEDEFQQIRPDTLYTAYYFTERDTPYLVAIIPSTQESP